MVDINGYCNNQFEPLRQAFIDNFSEGREIGASLAAMHKGEMVLNIWAGYKDEESKAPWEEDTIVNVFSTGKIVAIVCMLMLVDRELIDLDKPVAAYWPEFAQGGKENVTVRDAMTHRALVPGLRPPISYESAQDWNRFTAAIANQKAWFDPGTLCYHPINYGGILGELVRRVTGLNLDEFCRLELTEPLGADFQFKWGGRADQARTATLNFMAESPFEEGTFEFEVMNSVLEPPPGFEARQSWDQLNSLRPGARGFSSAQGLARIAGLLALGGIFKGKRYLSEAVIKEARTEQVHGTCPLMGELRLGLGFGLDSPGFRAPTPMCYHWGGYGGSVCVIDPVNQTGFAYVMNRCITDEQVQDNGGIEVIDSRLAEFWKAYPVVVGAGS